MWGFFSLGLVLVAGTIAQLLRRYAAPSVPYIVLATTAYAWAVSMSIVLVTPLDVAATLMHEPEPAVSILWKITYWSTQVLTWLVLPFFQVYADAGDFTVGGRCMTSLKENGLLYGLAGAAGAVGLIIIVVIERGLKLTDLAALGMALSNTFGLSVGILLMGYGLVEIPRGLWKSDPTQLLKWSAHRAGRFAVEVVKTTDELERVVTIIVANDKQMPRRDPLRPLMEVIVSSAEEHSPVKLSAIIAANVDLESLAADDLEYNYDVAGLAALRRRLTAAIHDFQGAHAQYEEVILHGLDLEAVVKCRQLGVFEPPGLPASATGSRAALQRLVWRYRCSVEPLARKVFAALLVGLSACVVWSSATIFTGGHPDLSPFSLMIRSAVGSEWGVQLLVMWPLAYICFCTYFALFRLNAFNYNKLLPRTTTGAALMQNGSLMARFAAPTCWNLLHMVHMDGKLDEAGTTTVFTQNMGTMTVLPVLGKHLNTYLPLLLVVHCTLIWLNLWDRMAGACMGSKYRFSNDDVDDQFTEKGRQLIRKEGEALAAGMRIGEVLAAGDLELPGVAPRRKPGSRGKGQWFSKLLGRQQQSGGGTDGAAGGGVSGITSSSQAAAVDGAGSSSRGEQRSSMMQLLTGGARSDEQAGVRTGLLSSLVQNKYGASPSSSDGEAGGAAGAGLDGIFAELNSGQGRLGPTRPQWRVSRS